MDGLLEKAERRKTTHEVYTMNSPQDTDYCDQLVEALYQCFTSPIVFPSDRLSRYYLSLVDLGYAEPTAQGHAMGYRIAPDGHKIAMARWGHEQS